MPHALQASRRLRELEPVRKAGNERRPVVAHFESGVGLRHATVEYSRAQVDVTQRSDQPLSISTTRHGASVLIISLRGELDIVSADELLPALELLRDHEGTGIVIDASGLDYVDSSGLNALVGGAKAIKANGGRVVVARPPEHVARVFEIVHMDEYFDVEASLDAAIQRAEKEPRGDHEPS
jgi:anti-anti-sigma factor